jgi:membrane fusion protein (multidrug efflux system)
MLKKILMLVLTISIVFLVLTACKNAEGKDQSSGKKDEKSKTETQNKETKKDEADDSVPVEVTQITNGTISSFQLYNSTIEAENSVDVYAKVSGIIIDLKVEEGNYINKGQLLAKIEDEDYKLEESGAKATYEKTKRDFERSETMYRDKLLSENDYEQVRYNYEQAKITWERAKVRLGNTSIIAPISGILSSRTIKYGDYITVNTKVFSIVDMNTLITRVYIPEKDIVNVKVNQPAIITSDALGEKEFDGRIKIINPVVDPNTGTVKVTIALKGYANILKPGMFVKSHIIIATRDNTMLLTKKAIVYNGIQSIAYVVKNGIANQVVLEIGFQDSEKVEVLNKNIKTGDKIIVVGQYGLKDKSKVKVINEKA